MPTQNFGYELSAHGLGFSVNDVPGMPDAHGFNFSGLSAEFRYLVIGRGPGSPVGFTLVAEPEWARIDDGGQPITDFNMTFRGILDTELIPNRLYAATNIFYTPDYARSPGESWAWSAEYGVSGAMAYRFTPKLTMGAEIEYDAAYDGAGIQSFQGQALYLGPTLHYSVQRPHDARGGMVDPDRRPCQRRKLWPRPHELPAPAGQSEVRN